MKTIFVVDDSATMVMSVKNALEMAGFSVETACDGGTPILVAGEKAGVELPYGCRMGICHSCTCRKAAGAVRNLRTGEVSDEEDEDIQLCISVPAGDIALDI